MTNDRRGERGLMLVIVVSGGWCEVCVRLMPAIYVIGLTYQQKPKFPLHVVQAEHAPSFAKPVRFNMPAV